VCVVKNKRQEEGVGVGASPKAKGDDKVWREASPSTLGMKSESRIFSCIFQECSYIIQATGAISTPGAENDINNVALTK